MNQGLAWVVATLFAILPLAHVPALRNLLSLAAGILITALLMRERRMPPLPAFPMAAWIALGTASALWSADPAATLHGVLYSMLLPAGVFLAAWRVAADDRAFARARWAAAGGVLCLSIMVVLGLATGLSAPAAPSTMQASSAVSPCPSSAATSGCKDGASGPASPCSGRSWAMDSAGRRCTWKASGVLRSRRSNASPSSLRTLTTCFSMLQS